MQSFESKLMRMWPISTHVNSPRNDDAVILEPLKEATGLPMKAIRIVLSIAWLMVAVLAGPAVAGPFEDAVSAYERGDYTTAMRLQRPLADQGHVAAQFNLGHMYDNGRGVPQDYA